MKQNLKKITSRIPSVIYILFFGALGFVIGVLKIGLWQENWLVSGGILAPDFIDRIHELCVDKRALFFLCLGRRLRAFFILFLLAFSTVNVFSNMFFFWLYGVYIGSVMELFVVRYGWQGIMMYVSLVFPQGIFYTLGFVILGCWCLNLEKTVASALNKKLEKAKKVRGVSRLTAAFLFILLGSLLESFMCLEIFQLFF